jgi:hypothetical protein
MLSQLRLEMVKKKFVPGPKSSEQLINIDLMNLISPLEEIDEPNQNINRNINTLVIGSIGS